MLRKMSMLMVVLLIIEFMDELFFGTREAALPLIRSDLNLSYEQIGLLITIPAFLAGFIEPVLGILADTWKRRVLVLGGGVVFALCLIGIGAAQSYLVMMIAHILFFPASGAFVTLSQTVLMDSDPTRHDQNMARWTFAGSLGVVVGPLLLSVALALGIGWRELMLFLAGVTMMVVALAWRQPFPTAQVSDDDEEEEDIRPKNFRDGLRLAWVALQRREVLRWLILLQFMDLMLDILLGFLALYFVDVVGLTVAQAATGVLVWTGVGLLGDFLLIPLLERVEGLRYLRVSVIMELLLYPAFLLVPGMIPKFVILALHGFFNAGWYAVLSGRLYAEMRGQSGTVVTLLNVVGFLGATFPVIIGFAASRWGLEVAMWLLLAGPIALLIGLPRQSAPMTMAELELAAGD